MILLLSFESHYHQLLVLSDFHLLHCCIFSKYEFNSTLISQNNQFIILTLQKYEVQLLVIPKHLFSSNCFEVKTFRFQLETFLAPALYSLI